MFSPSLLSMMAHSCLSESPLEGILEQGKNAFTYKDSRELAEAVARLTKSTRLPVLPRLPIVGRITFLKPNFISRFLEVWFHKEIAYDSFENATYFWGRVPVNQLADQAVEFSGMPAEGHYVDLGTTLTPAGSPSTLDIDCQNYLSRSAAPGQAKVGAAIIDLGVDSTIPPNTYGNNLRHAVSGIELSEHAKKVLAVMLERLDKSGILSSTTVSCALVRPPASMVSVGKRWHEQANTVEILDAVKALEPQLTNDKLPAAVNISLGTHVGPHNGDSPLEEYISNKLIRRNERFVVAAAGNDGGTGVAAKRWLRPNDSEFLSLQTGPRCKDLLVEFWWDDSSGANLNLEALIYEPLATGGRAYHGKVRVDQNRVGDTLTYMPAGLPSQITSHSLFQAKCRNNLGCIAFALSTPRPALPVLEVRFVIESAKEVVVNAWIVVCEDHPQTTFIEGGPDGTVRVPASDGNILSVAGVEDSGQMWAGSSRGPAAVYQLSNFRPVPMMAHQVAFNSESGTSYASPRACADAVFALARNVSKCNDAIDLMCEAYNRQRNALPRWDHRYGFLKVK